MFKFHILFFILLLLAACGTDSTRSDSSTNSGQSQTEELYLTIDTLSNSSLWKTDGTSEGTLLVKDLTSEASCRSPHRMTQVGNILYFSGLYNFLENELCKSDGSADGTVMVKDIAVNWPSSPWDITAVGNTIYFTADDFNHGRELWKTDGTELGTVLVKDILTTAGLGSGPAYLTAFNGSLLFSAVDSVEGRELWISDGTGIGTKILKNIDSSSGDSLPHDLLATDTLVFFTADDGVHGMELWATDGSAAGTFLVADIHPTGSSDPNYLVKVNNTVYFAAFDGAGFDLWKTDGTALGTTKVANFTDPIYDIKAAGNHVFLETYTPASRSIYVSDGTATGTQRLKDLYPSENYYITLHREVNGEIYFGARPTTQQMGDIWKSDGTESGTMLVTETSLTKYTDLGIVPGVPFSHYEVNNAYLFTFGGSLLWRTDGTEAGTVLIKNLAE